MGLSSPVPSTMRHPESVGGWREKRALKKSDSHSKKTIVARRQMLSPHAFTGVTRTHIDERGKVGSRPKEIRIAWLTHATVHIARGHTRNVVSESWK